MDCPKCLGKLITKDVVNNPIENEIYRMKKCSSCGHTFFTVEYEVTINKRFEEDWAEHHRSKIHIKEEYKK